MELVGRVEVRVNEFGVLVGMGVPSPHRQIVLMVMMSVIVAMTMRMTLSRVSMEVLV